jgi:hypothetical protein
MRRIARQLSLRRRAGISLIIVGTLAVAGTAAATQAFGARPVSAAEAPAAPQPLVKTWHNGALTAVRTLFGQTTEPYTGKETPVFRYTLSNASGMSVRILTYGGDRPGGRRARRERP